MTSGCPLIFLKILGHEFVSNNNCGFANSIKAQMQSKRNLHSFQIIQIRDEFTYNAIKYSKNNI